VSLSSSGGRKHQTFHCKILHCHQANIRDTNSTTAQAHNLSSADSTDEESYFLKLKQKERTTSQTQAQGENYFPNSSRRRELLPKLKQKERTTSPTIGEKNGGVTQARHKFGERETKRRTN
jgi:hypothetical protein